MYKRIGLALIPGAAFAAVFIVRSSWVTAGHRRFSLFDDAMISMSYARTLSRTGELVWFEGAARVEGFTNPLWTFVMAALHVVGLTASQISVAIMLIGLLCLLASAVLAAWLSFQLNPASRWAPVVTAFVMSLTYPLIFWSLRGMEVGLVLLLTLACLVCAVRSSDGTQTARRRRGWLAGAMTLIVLGLATRIDFVVIALVIAGWTTWQTAPGAARRRTAVLLGASIGVPLLAMTLARSAYYGEIVPNTYTLKVSGASLWMRLERGIRTDLKLVPMFLLAGLGAAVIWRDGHRRTRRLLVLLAATGLATVAYSTYVGGDAWESVPNRYVSTFVACAGIVAITGLEKAAHVPRYRRGVAVAVAVLVAFSGLALGFSDHFHVSLAVSGVGGFVVIVTVFLMLRLLPEKHVRRSIVMIGVATLAVLFASSGLGFAQWLRGRQLIGLDQRYASTGFVLGRLTEPTARIACRGGGRRGLLLRPPSGRPPRKERPGHRRRAHPGRLLSRSRQVELLLQHLHPPPGRRRRTVATDCTRRRHARAWGVRRVLRDDPRKDEPDLRANRQHPRQPLDAPAGPAGDLRRGAIGAGRFRSGTRLLFLGAGDRIRTGDINLGKVALYQLSYVRLWCTSLAGEPRIARLPA